MGDFPNDPRRTSHARSRIRSGGCRIPQHPGRGPYMIEKRTPGARSRLVHSLTALALLATACGGTESPNAEFKTDNPLATASSHRHKKVCSSAPAGHLRCHSWVRVNDVTGDVQPFVTPAGFGPADLASAYQLPAGGGAGITIAIVDAMDDPNAESDLATYRSQFGLPACTTANGCFKKVNQTGQANPLPASDAGWAGEISLDVDMVSAICPNCHIVLVEATSPTIQNLGTSVNEAVALGAK